MSRNLADRCCHICDASPDDISLLEAPRLITAEEYGPYVEYMNTLWVADAVCVRCDAKYLAWVKETTHRGHEREASKVDRFVDLSFRYSFNDEPSPADLPSPATLERIHREHTTMYIEGRIQRSKESLDEVTAIAKEMNREPFYETYRHERDPHPRSPSVRVVITTPCRGQRGWWVASTEPQQALREVLKESEELGFLVTKWPKGAKNKMGLISDENGMTLVTVIVEP